MAEELEILKEIPPELIMGMAREMMLHIKTPNEAIAQAISDMSSEEKAIMLTHIIPGEEMAFSIWLEIAESERFDWLKRILKYNLVLRRSWKRLSRRELVRMVTARGSRELETRRWFRWPWQKREGEER